MVFTISSSLAYSPAEGRGKLTGSPIGCRVYQEPAGPRPRLRVGSLTLIARWYILVVLTRAAGLQAGVAKVAIQSLLNPDAAVFERQTPGTDGHRPKRSGSRLMSRKVLPYVIMPKRRPQKRRGCRSWLKSLHQVSGFQGMHKGTVDTRTWSSTQNKRNRTEMEEKGPSWALVYK